ncbi:MAG: hypothetical protein CMC86_00310 [Flavobacteriaceae bacterium]|nr:hypothetical protein [Flavobacteriaceae bacterium]|tara:strand:- start:37963 stop:39291 length:1329 start_codon:yes stop_codon:yes gene_type:complete
MKKITFLFLVFFSFSFGNSQTIMTHNSSQEITDQVSKICQSYDDSDINWNFFCEGIWDDPNYSCPPTSFFAPITDNYILRITDVFGDGWFGTTLSISVNGLEVLSDVGLDFDNNWEKEFTFSANEGDFISANWSNIGPWFNQCGYKIASESEVSSVEFPSYTNSQIYYRHFVPYDYGTGFQTSLDLTHVQFGVWYTDINGVNTPNLPDVNVQCNLYLNNAGGVGGEWGLNLDNLTMVAQTAEIQLTADDHQSILTVPIEYAPTGFYLENGYSAYYQNDYVVELIFPSGAPTDLHDGFRLTTAGNYSDFFLDATSQSPNPSTRTLFGNDMCLPFFTYTPDNSSLINLITSSELDSGLGLNDVELNNITIQKYLYSDYITVLGLINQKSALLQLFSITGQKIFSKNIDSNNDNQRFYIPGLNSGIYIAKLFIDGTSINKKIVVR